MSILKRKKSWLLLALLLMTSSCSYVSCRFGSQLYYIFDFNSRLDQYAMNVYIAEGGSSTAASILRLLYLLGFATPAPFLSGSRGTYITGYYSSANTASGGAYLVMDNSIGWINGKSGLLRNTIALPTTGFQDFHIEPGGKYGYATSKSSSLAYNIDLTTYKVSSTIDFGLNSRPYGSAFLPDGTRTYFTDNAKNQFYSLDNLSKTFRTMTLPGTNPGKPAISPDGLSLWFPMYGSNKVLVYDRLTETLTTTISNVPSPREISFNYTGTRAYALSSPASGVGSVWALDAGNYSVLGNVNVGFAPMGMSWSPGGTRLFTANSGSGTVSMLDVSGKIPLSALTFDVGSNPTGVVAVPAN